MQDDFKFFRNYYEILKKMPANKCGKLVIAMCEYILNDKEPVFSEAEWGLAGVFASLRLSLDKAKTIHEKRSVAGAQGGRGNTKQIETEIPTQESKEKQTQSKPKAKESKLKASTKQTKAKQETRNKKQEDNKLESLNTNDEKINVSARESDATHTNIFSLADCSGMRPRYYTDDERQPLLAKMGRYYDYWDTYKDTTFGAALKLIADTILEAMEYVHIFGTALLVDGQALNERELLDLLNCDEYVYTALAKRLSYQDCSDVIRNEPMYILSTLLREKR